MAAIECTLRESEAPEQPQPVGRDDFGAGAGDANLQKIIEDLHREKEELDRIIASFEELLGAKTMATFQKKRRGRKSMSAEERLKVSTRMTRYWQTRRAVDLELSYRKGNDSSSAALLRGGVVLHRRMKKAVRREPDLKLPFLSHSNRWLRSISYLIPSILAAYEIDLLLLPSEWGRAAEPRGTRLNLC